MTVIFGLTFLTGALVGADTLRHNALNNKSVGSASKVRSFGKRAVVAKSGYGPSADPVWDAIRRRINGEDLDAGDVADIVVSEGAKTLAICSAASKEAGHPDPGLSFIVSGLTDDRPSLHGIQLADQQRCDVEGHGKVIAFGMRQTTSARAHELAETLIRKESDRLLLNAWDWARELIEEERCSNPHAIGFPGEMLFVRPGLEVETMKVDPALMLNPRAIVSMS
ncbi:hypothetical protein [Sphingomonas sp. PB4P5]|uniref:hypothetical protein n=1 Tax=Parasphingomonas puruogangriensis TaxID=3096155 RepID=UPI002FCA8500